MACGQSGHFRPECPLVASENRVTAESGSEGSPKASSGGGKAGGKVRPKAKAGAQAKGIIEEAGQATAASVGAGTATAPSTPSPEALVAEAAKSLKGVSLKPLRVEEDESWIRNLNAKAMEAVQAKADKAGLTAFGGQAAVNPLTKRSGPLEE